MHHVTLDTGHVRWSPRDEVDSGLMRLLLDHIQNALHRRAPVPTTAGRYVAHATAHRDVLMLTVEDVEVPAPRPMPIVTLAVVPVGVDVREIAALMMRGSPVPPMPSDGPWCLVRLYPTIALARPEDVAWMGDYERCVAWAWLATPATTAH